ncbi:Hypothetical predicted protein [Xyrichtys novacula]|uniref:Uncharacterized protein n=1 Tax=Xyrichtys novacula TaxID=13765 RepID=A0AAV1F7I1_XYRNO|nr:Hypothetical predicted protein [Xyrichtys novacula]
MSTPPLHGQEAGCGCRHDPTVEEGFGPTSKQKHTPSKLITQMSFGASCTS